MSDSLYLYCVAEGKWQEGLVLNGLGGASVFTVATAGLVAVVQECDAPFSSEDSKLVSEWILAHQAVVDLAWEKYETVVPGIRSSWHPGSPRTIRRLGLSKRKLFQRDQGLPTS